MGHHQSRSLSFLTEINQAEHWKIGFEPPDIPDIPDIPHAECVLHYDSSAYTAIIVSRSARQSGDQVVRQSTILSPPITQKILNRF